MKSMRAQSNIFGTCSKSFVTRVILTATLLIFQGCWQGLQANDLSPFIGSYVGHAIVEDLAAGKQEERDLDIVVVPHGEDGLRIDWVTVGLVGGRRDAPGVRRWAQTALFEPSADNDFMIEVGERSVFKERQAVVPIKGDPVRWTRVDGDSLHTCSFVVLEDGRYELQVYQRILTDIGMDIHFERIVDGEVTRRVIGTTARAG